MADDNKDSNRKDTGSKNQESKPEITKEDILENMRRIQEEKRKNPEKFKMIKPEKPYPPGTGLWGELDKPETEENREYVLKNGEKTASPIIEPKIDKTRSQRRRIKKPQRSILGRFKVKVPEQVKKGMLSLKEWGNRLKSRMSPTWSYEFDDGRKGNVYCLFKGQRECAYGVTISSKKDGKKALISKGTFPKDAKDKEVLSFYERNWDTIKENKGRFGDAKYFAFENHATGERLLGSEELTRFKHDKTVRESSKKSGPIR